MAFIILKACIDAHMYWSGPLMTAHLGISPPFYWISVGVTSLIFILAFPISAMSLSHTIVDAYCIWICTDSKLHFIQLVPINTHRLAVLLTWPPKSMRTYIAGLALNQNLVNALYFLVRTHIELASSSYLIFLILRCLASPNIVHT